MVLMLLVRLNADFDDFLEDGRVFPADRGETSTGIQDGDGLHRLHTDTDARNVARGWNVQLDQATDDLIVGHRRALMVFWQWAAGWVQKDGVLQQMQFELAWLEEGREHGLRRPSADDR